MMNVIQKWQNSRADEHHCAQCGKTCRTYKHVPYPNRGRGKTTKHAASYYLLKPLPDRYTGTGEVQNLEVTANTGIVSTDEESPQVPVLTEAAYTEPVQAEPVYVEPTYKEPSYKEPAHKEPVLEQSGIAAPVKTNSTFKPDIQQLVVHSYSDTEFRNLYSEQAGNKKTAEGAQMVNSELASVNAPAGAEDLLEAHEHTYSEEQCRLCPEDEGLFGRGLYHYRKWWELINVDIVVNGDLLNGTPIFTDKNTLRVVNSKYSYFIPLEKVDYIRTCDGLESSATNTEIL